jgi:hypothetical protein
MRMQSGGQGGCLWLARFSHYAMHSIYLLSVSLVVPSDSVARILNFAL